MEVKIIILIFQIKKIQRAWRVVNNITGEVPLELLQYY